MKPTSHKYLPLVDSHLDLAENVTIFGRDLLQSVSQIRASEMRTSKQASVSLPELSRGGIAVAIATVTPGFLPADVPQDFEPKSAFYTSPQEAETQALSQIDLYERWERQGRVRLIKSVRDLDDHLELWTTDRKIGLVMLMESADAIVSVGDLPRWWERGLRMIGLTLGDTRYGHGVGGGHTVFTQGGLTAEGLALLERMAGLGFIWDISHLAEQGVWEGLDSGFPRVCASHANARALTPTDRHLSDDVIRTVARRGGVIGLVLYNGFLEFRWTRDRTISVTLKEQLYHQAKYVAGLAGWDHVGVGSDLDGGFGLEESPAEINTVADLYKIGATLPDEVRDGVLGANWVAFLRSSLPTA